jgi:hypothetical protein
MRAIVSTRSTSGYRPAVARSRSTRRRTLHPMTGQLFEVRVTRDESRWAVTIPELDAIVHVEWRADAESAARECNAVRTGIPIGYVAVWVRD